MHPDRLSQGRLSRSQLAVELLEDRSLLSATIPAHQVIDASSTDYDPSTILVRFHDGVTAPVDGNQIMPGTAVGRTVAPLLVPGLHEVELAPGVGVPAALAAYNNSALVEYAEPNFHIYATDTIPNDSLWNNSGMTGMRRIRAPLAWDYWVGGSGNVVMANIDTGVDYNHPDLAPVMWSGLGWNFVNNTPNPLDDNGHGSHTAGTMGAAGNNGLGVVGVNWYTPIMALKALNAAGSGNLSWSISALNFAVANGAVVSNNSYGCYSCFTQAFFNALVSANNNYHVFVAAAGNDNRNIDVSANRHYPASYQVGNVIAVAATNSTNDNKASFSNYGPATVHIAAPGVNILSTYRNGQYALASGTSQAAPYVAGAMALMIDYFGVWGTPSDMRDWLMYTADYVPALGPYVISSGRLNVAQLLGVFAGPTPGGGGGRFEMDPLFREPLTSPALAVGDLAALPVQEGPRATPTFALPAKAIAPGQEVTAQRVRSVSGDPFTWEPGDFWLVGW